MTLAQVKTLIIGVLKGWFTNKKVLDKIGENEAGEFTYNGSKVDTDTVTDDDVNNAIAATITELNK